MTCRKVVLFVLSSIGLAVCLNQSLGFGCSCVDHKNIEREDIADQVGGSKVIFEDQVESMRIGVRAIHVLQGPNLTRDELDHYGLFKIRALHVYKGRRRGTDEIRTGLGGGTCGFPFQIGARYLIYADESVVKNSGLFETSICQRTRYLDDAAADLRYLRGQAPTAKDVSPRKELSDADRQFRKVGTISGSVIRSDGGDVKNLDVVAWVLRDGVRRFAWWACFGVKIGPDGSYRMPLEEAGQYCMGVSNRWEDGESAIAFYNGAARLEEASGLEVKIGNQIRNVDMTARRPALYQVQGTIGNTRCARPFTRAPLRQPL